MGYLGTKPQSGFISQEANQYFTGLTQNYIDLNQSINSLSSVIILVNGVVQENSTLTLTTSSRITLGATLVASDKVTCIYLAKISSTQAPASSSVTNDMLAGSITGAKLTDSTITSSKIASGVIPTSRPNAKPLIINGDMAVAQRSANATGLGGGSGYKSLDRWYSTFFYSSSNVGTFTQSQSTDVPTGYGFRNSFKTDCTTAQTSLPASGQINVRYTVEAQDLNPFKFGTANAEKMTLAFWVKSNLTGTYNVSLYNQDGGSTPQVNSQYSISSANTWEKKVLVFPADTSNGFNDDNGAGLSIDWIMGSGSTYTGGTAPTTWSSFVNNTYNGGSTINMASSTDNEWLITGVQLEVGEYTSSSLPAFQHETFQENFNRCARYFFYTGGGSTYASHGVGTEVSATAGYVNIPLITPMRSAPSATHISQVVLWDGNSESNIQSLGNVYYANYGSIVQVACNVNGGLDDTAGVTAYSSNDNTSGFELSSEL